MEALYNQSKIKAIGVSNYCASCLKCLLPKVHVPPVVNQFEFHVGMGADPHGIVSASENAHTVHIPESARADTDVGFVSTETPSASSLSRRRPAVLYADACAR